MEETTLVRLEKNLIAAVKKDADAATHQDLPYGRSVAWLHGEYKRLKRLEKQVAPDLTTVKLTPAGQEACK
jgi:hypothetical protein